MGLTYIVSGASNLMLSLFILLHHCTQNTRKQDDNMAFSFTSPVTKLYTFQPICNGNRVPGDGSSVAFSSRRSAACSYGGECLRGRFNSS